MAKITDEQMRDYINQNFADYLNTFQEQLREEKNKELDEMETKKLYQKVHTRLANEAKKKTEIYPHLQYIAKCSDDDLSLLDAAIQSRKKSIKNQLKTNAKKKIEKIRKEFEKLSGETMIIRYGE